MSVVLENVRKVFPDPERPDRAVTAVDGVSLEVADGELVTLLGPSGCGKTTVLRIIAGFETPTEGRVLIGAGSSPPCRLTSATPPWSSRAMASSRT